MKITVVGGGNLGTLMAAEFAHKGHKVTIYTSKPQKWNLDICIYNAKEELLFTGQLYKVTNSIKDALEGAEYIWITLPAFLFEKAAEDMLPYVKKGQYIGIVPGSGGAEFAFRQLIKTECILFGLQRVHSIARIKEYGKSVYMLGRKSGLYLGAIPSKYAISICMIVEELFDIKCMPLENYLSVTLTPSNPILHTTRLYTLFKDYNKKKTYSNQIFFYEQWDDESSENLIACDNELQILCDKIPLPLSAVRSLREYYESFNVADMTRKISEIEAFKGILAPMKMKGTRWIPDFESRYFTADFPWGLKVIKEIASVYEVMTPNIDRIWMWYEKNHPNINEKSFVLPLEKDEFLEIY